MKNYRKFDGHDLAEAMKNAVISNSEPSLTVFRDYRVLFNGFWRNGDKQNVCIWLDKATWHDAKTGEGGGCKEFAKVAFNMSLPEFMKRFGNLKAEIPTINIAKAFAGPDKPNKPIYEICEKLEEKDQARPDKAELWLKNKRGLDNPRGNIFSRFSNLDKSDLVLFEPKHQKFVHDRLKVASQMVVPLRGVNSSKPQNLFFRSIEDCHKAKKSRLLSDVGGWHDPDGTPRGFGFPHAIYEFPNLILCEGMADYFATECLLGDAKRNYLNIGAANAAALIEWADYLVKTNYKGQVLLVYQLDKAQNGQVSSSGIGQSKAAQAVKILLAKKIEARLFNWGRFLKQVKPTQIPKDLADLCPLVEHNQLAEAFIKEI